ncbi:MAG TPA: hypothetical protein VFQ77_15435 [Pseudonocardiaceae bacterium]|jgi:hypothetical protein|nr:hypothetical protein [Pseudonocardiaceae bacterium]
MTNDSELVFRIGLVGPSRVGKTSLITAVLRDSQRLLQGTPVAIKAVGSPTEKRIAQHRRDLDGSLLAGEFSPGALRGTEEPFTFQLLLDPGVPGAGIRLELLDYPGGWVDSSKRPHDRDADWEQCKRFLVQSSVLMIPVDATVLMEPTASAHLRAVPSILTTPEVSEVVREWLKERNWRAAEPALLLICPVKCESYFHDNGGRRDESDNLLEMVRRTYADMIEGVPEEAPHVKVVYCPVDTIGCVEIIHVEWTPDPREPSGMAFSAHYGVRWPGRQNVKGAAEVLMALCRHLVAARRKVELEDAEGKELKASQAQAYADKDEGLFRNMWYHINGERKRRAAAAAARTQDAIDAQKRVTALTEIIADLAERDPGSRVHQW